MELRPCPFCRSSKVKVAERYSDMMWVPFCESCRCQLDDGYLNQDLAARAWNTRPQYDEMAKIADKYFEKYMKEKEESDVFHQDIKRILEK